MASVTNRTSAALARLAAQQAAVNEIAISLRARQMSLAARRNSSNGQGHLDGDVDSDLAPVDLEALLAEAIKKLDDQNTSVAVTRRNGGLTLDSDSHSGNINHEPYDGAVWHEKNKKGHPIRTVLRNAGVIVKAPNGSFVELACPVCEGGNASQGAYLVGARGFCDHLRFQHGEPGTTGGPGAVIARCKIRDVSKEEVELIEAGSRKVPLPPMIPTYSTELVARRQKNKNRFSRREVMELDPAEESETDVAAQGPSQRPKRKVAQPTRYRDEETSPATKRRKTRSGGQRKSTAAKPTAAKSTAADKTNASLSMQRPAGYDEDDEEPAMVKKQEYDSGGEEVEPSLLDNGDGSRFVKQEESDGEVNDDE